MCTYGGAGFLASTDELYTWSSGEHDGVYLYIHICISGVYIYINISVYIYIYSGYGDYSGLARPPHIEA